MGVIFEREFKSLIRNIKAVICIAVFACISGLFFLVNNLTAGYPGMHSVFSNMSLIAAVIIPAVASGAVSRERKRGTDAFLAALPVTKWQIILGKFAALLAFFMIPTAVIAVYPFILFAVGGTPMGQGYIMLLVFILFEAFLIALCLMVSCLCIKTWKAMVISYAVIVVSFVLGMIAPLFNGFVETALRFVSPFRRFDPIVFDLFDISSAVFYLSLTALFLWIALLGFKNRKAVSATARSAKKKTVTLTAIVSAALICVNAAACLLPSGIRQLDISTDGVYSVTDTTDEYLSAIDDEITVYLLNPMSAEEKLHTYIRRYCERSDKITLKEVDTTSDAEFLSKYGMTEAPALYSMIIESEKTGRWKLVTSEEYFLYHNDTMGFMSPSEYESAISYYSQMYSYYSQYSSSADVTEYLNSAQEALYQLSYGTSLCLNAEEAMTSAIEYVRADYVPTLYFASGHGEKNSSANPLDLKELGAIPQSASLIVINDPDEDYSAEEISMLQAYSDRGGRLMIITDESVNEKPNLLRLLAGFGLSAESGAVSVDGKTDVTATVNTSSAALADMPFSSMTVSGGSSIISGDIDELEFSRLLTVSIPASEEGGEAEEKTLGMSVTKNGAAKLIWFTGADSFNRDTSSMTDEEKEEYTKAAYCVQYSVSWLWIPFSSSLKFDTPGIYESAMLVADSGMVSWVGVIFVGLLPLAMIGAALINGYARKKRSRAVNTAE